MGTGMTTMPWVWVRVRVLHVKKSRVRIRDQVYGISFHIRITMGTGMSKGTTSLVEPFEKLGTGLSMKEGFVESVFKC